MPLEVHKCCKYSTQIAWQIDRGILVIHQPGECGRLIGVPFCYAGTRKSKETLIFQQSLVFVWLLAIAPADCLPNYKDTLSPKNYKCSRQFRFKVINSPFTIQKLRRQTEIKSTGFCIRFLFFLEAEMVGHHNISKLGFKEM